jgi:hypothetical protein
MARPLSVIVLIVSPKALKTRTATRYRDGGEGHECRARVDQENEEDHGYDDPGLDQDSLDIVDRGLDELACRNWTFVTVIPAGIIVRCRSCNVVSILRVSATVSDAGCF